MEATYVQPTRSFAHGSACVATHGVASLLQLTPSPRDSAVMHVSGTRLFPSMSNRFTLCIRHPCLNSYAHALHYENTDPFCSDL